jgi:hypothetical protein
VSEFVNYSKRSVTLPDGCKDLADVLKRKSTVIAQTSTCKLSDIGKYLSKAWASSTPELCLWFTPGNQVDFSLEQLRFSVQRLPGKGLHADVTVKIGTEAETVLRQLMEKRGF